MIHQAIHYIENMGSTEILSVCMGLTLLANVLQFWNHCRLIRDIQPYLRAK